MKRREAPVRRVWQHEFLDLLGPRTLAGGSELLQCRRERDVTDRRAVREARAAHQRITRGPGADAVQPREIALGRDGRAVAE